MEIKLPKLPDRRPVKIAITVSADLGRKLQTYADLYQQSYRDEEPVAELIPYMLESFLNGDKAFSNAVRASSTATKAK